jgi:hypothetical protein
MQVQEKQWVSSSFAAATQIREPVEIHLLPERKIPIGATGSSVEKLEKI